MGDCEGVLVCAQVKTISKFDLHKTRKRERSEAGFNENIGDFVSFVWDPMHEKNGNE